MIQISLLPDEFRVKAKSTHKIPAVQIAVGVGILLSILTIYFYIDFLAASSELGKLNQRWKEVARQAASHPRAAAREVRQVFESVKDTFKSKRSLLYDQNRYYRDFGGR